MGSGGEFFNFIAYFNLFYLSSEKLAGGSSAFNKLYTSSGSF
jgi:hypothetical protein